MKAMQLREKMFFLSLLIFIFLISPPCFSFFDQVEGDLYRLRDGVGVVYYDASGWRLVVFSPSGKVIHESVFPQDKTAYAHPLGILADQTLVMLSERQTEQSDVTTSEVIVYGLDGKARYRKDLPAGWDLRVQGGSIRGVPPGMSQRNVQVSEFTIHTLDVQSEEAKPEIVLPKGSRTIRDWYTGPMRNYLLSGEESNTFLECYSSEPRLLWRLPVFDRPIESMDVTIADVDESGKVSLLIRQGQKDAEVAVYSPEGRLQAHRSIPNLSALLSFEGGSFGLIQTDLALLSPTFSIAQRWTFTAPKFGENWDEKWSREKRAATTTTASSLEDQILAIVYSSNSQQLSELMTGFRKRGLEVLPRLLKSLSMFPSSDLIFVIGQIATQDPEQAQALIWKEFESASYDQRKLLLECLNFEGEHSVPETLNSFLLEMRDKGSQEDHETAEQWLIYLGLDEGPIDQLISRLRAQGLSDKERQTLEAELTGQSTEMAFRKLEAILLNPSDPLREQSRTILLLIGVIDTRDQLENSTARKYFEEWTSNQDPFVSDFATIGLASFGVAGTLMQAMQIAKRDPVLCTYLLRNFGWARANSMEIHSVSKDLVDLAIKMILSSKDENDTYAAVGALSAAASLPEIQVAMLNMILDPTVPSKVRSSVCYGLSPHVDKISRQDVLHLIQSVDSSISGDPAFYTFLSAIRDQFKGDPQVREAFRSRIIYELSRAESRDYSSILQGFKGLVEKDDVSMLLPFLEMEHIACGGTLVKQTLELLSELNDCTDFQDAVLPFLSQPEYAIAAAKALSPSARPDVLDVLLRAVQSSEDHHLEGRFFLHFGIQAENALLPLLYSANDAVRERAAMLLAEMRSEQALSSIHSDIQDDLKQGKFPRPAFLGALVASGQNPWAEVFAHLRLDENACEDMVESASSFPESEAAVTVTLLEPLIMKERDPERAKAMICFLSGEPFYDLATPALKRIGENHPVPEVRKFVTTIEYIDD